MQSLLPLGEKLGQRLKARGETVAVAESSAGGLISAILLAVPGASAYYLGGAVIYTRPSRELLLGILPSELEGMRPASEPYALLLARRVREKFSATWGIGETGATGPTGNRYGDRAGHACIAVVGPSERVITLETGSGDRVANMREFARGALVLLSEQLGTP